MSTSVASSNKSLNEIGSGSNSDSEKESDSNGSAVGERLRGDGQEHEQSATKKVDDDEDRRNPQYIPKRGNFYEHDDRTIELDEENPAGEPILETNVDVGGAGDAKASVEKDNPRNKKKIWEEKDHERWGHDLYIEKEQCPKTKQELINAYGYDIRNEDGPPRARRRRRYGRGPNKYTRNWEDEEAYASRGTGTRPPRRSNNRNPSLTQEDFPPLDKQLENQNEEIPNENYNKSREIKNSAWKKPKSRNPPLQGNNKEQYIEEKINKFKPNKVNSKNQVVVNDRPPKQQQGMPYRPDGKMEPTGNGNRQNKSYNNTKPIRENIATQEQTIGTISSQSFSNSNRSKVTSRDVNPDTVIREMENLKLDDQNAQYLYNTRQNQSNQNNSPHASQRHHQQAPEINHLTQMPQPQPQQPQQSQQQRAGGPKRYSSLRQRSLPETTPPTFNQPNNQPHQVSSGYYQTEYGNQPPADSQMGMHQMPMNTSGGAAQPMSRPIHGSAPVNVHHQNLLVAASQQPLLSIPPNANPSQASPHQQQIMSAIPQNQSMQLGHGQYGATSPGAYQAAVAAATYNLPAAPAAAAAYLQQPPPTVINYAGTAPGPQPPAQYSPAGYPHPAPYQQAYPPAPVPATQELYQSQGGITYYSPHSQQVISRAPVRRAKAAIPILAPPEHSKPRGRGRSSPPNENNIDTITGSNNGTTVPRGRGRMSPTDTNELAKTRPRLSSNESVPFDTSMTNQIIASMTKNESPEIPNDEKFMNATNDDKGNNADVKDVGNVVPKRSRASDFFEDSNIDTNETQTTTTSVTDNECGQSVQISE